MDIRKYIYNTGICECTVLESKDDLCLSELHTVDKPRVIDYGDVFIHR